MELEFGRLLPARDRAVPLFLVAPFLAGIGGDSLTGPGVSHALAELRAAQIADVRYTLDLDVTRRDTLRGHALVRFVRRGGGDVVIDFRGLGYAQTTANGVPVVPRAEHGHLVIAGSALRDGENEVQLDFTSAIAPAGASVIRVHDAVDNADYLYTLLVPADANQLFPCFDQPDLKGRVSLALTTPRGWTAVANGRVTRVDTAAALTFRFAESEPISTYLVAFAAGPWAVRSSVIDGRPISLYVRASRAREVEADTLIALNARAIAWLEKYTAKPFPFQKFDFVLAPAFPFGGMEHPGAIFYNEESFIYRERPTLSQLLGREATIYHEVAHQWFGDFATMRWFDDLWLKEGFATYLAAVMQTDLESARECVEDVLSAQQAGGVCRRRVVWNDARLAAARQSRSGQEQLRRDRLQQGAGHPQAAQLPRRRHRLSRRTAALPPRSCVRQRDMARPARRRGRRGGSPPG